MLSRTSGVLENIIGEHSDLESTQLPSETFRLNDDDIRILNMVGRKSPETPSASRFAHLRRGDSEEIARRRSSCSSDVCARRTSSGGFYTAGHIVPVIRGKLYFTVQSDAQDIALLKTEHPLFCFFSSAHHESYLAYNTELGPVDLGVIVSFCKELQAQQDQYKDVRPLVYFTYDMPGHATNGALLLGCFLMLQHKMSAATVADIFSVIQPSPFEPFLDASGMQEFSLSLFDCFAALEHSIQTNWFSLQSFDLDEFNRLAHPSGGDVSYIGSKFIAFKGPVVDEELRQKREAHQPEVYAEMFSRMGVSAVVRLNEKQMYDAAVFTERGIRHYDVPFKDCTFPSRKVAKLFMDICDEAGLVAVHCKAGLGRTGTVIALWMMKNQGYTAKTAIAWLRMSRPGSVIGPQQSYLEKCELREWIGNWMGKTPADAGSSAVRKERSGEEEGGSLAERFDRECNKRAMVRASSKGKLVERIAVEANQGAVEEGVDMSRTVDGGVAVDASGDESGMRDAR